MPHLGLALALVLLPTCEEEGPTYRSIDLGVDVRLNAVESSGYGRFAAVGSNGTFVHQAADGGTVELVVVGDGGQAGIWSLNESLDRGCL
jgi:hypothetical protein